MAGFETDEPEFSNESEYCQVVRIGRNYKGAELTIFYTPNGGYEIHNGYLAKKRTVNSHGRSYDKLTIVTPRGKKIVVRRYKDDEGYEDDEGDDDQFEIMSQGYWISEEYVNL